MSGGHHRKAQKPRELRRRVFVTARLRQPSGWSDASILNISSRGLLIHSPMTPEPGSWVELRRGDELINARVVWRQGAKAGLQAEDRVPVEAIACAERASDLPPPPPTGERRRRPRNPDQSRLVGRAVEFAGVLAIAVSLAAGTVAVVGEAFARPLALVAGALG